MAQESKNEADPFPLNRGRAPGSYSPIVGMALVGYSTTPQLPHAQVYVFGYDVR